MCYTKYIQLGVVCPKLKQEGMIGLKKVVALMLALSVVFTFGLSMTAMAKIQPTESWNEVKTFNFESADKSTLINAGYPAGVYTIEDDAAIAHSESKFVKLDKTGIDSVAEKDKKGFIQSGVKILDTHSFTEADVGKQMRFTVWVYVKSNAGTNVNPASSTVRVSMIGKNGDHLVNNGANNATTDTFTYTSGYVAVPVGEWTSISVPFTVTQESTLAGQYGDVRVDGGLETNYFTMLYVDDVIWEELGETTYEDVPLNYTADFEGYSVGDVTGDAFISSGGEQAKGPVISTDFAYRGTKSVKKYERKAESGAIKFLNVFQSDLMDGDIGKTFRISAYVYADKAAGAYYKTAIKEPYEEFPLSAEDLAASEGVTINMGMYGPSGTKYSSSPYNECIVRQFVEWNTWTELVLYYTVDANAVADTVNAVRFCQVEAFPIADTFYVDDFKVEEIDSADVPAPATAPTVTMSEAKPAANGAQDTYYYVTTVDLGEGDINQVTTYFVPDNLKEDKTMYTVDEIEVPEIISMDGGNGTVTFASVLTGIPDTAKDRAIYARSSVRYFDGFRTPTVYDEDTTTLNTVLTSAQ